MIVKNVVSLKGNFQVLCKLISMFVCMCFKLSFILKWKFKELYPRARRESNRLEKNRGGRIIRVKEDGVRERKGRK